MDGSQVVALASVIVSPAGALAGVWLTSSLTARQRRRDQQDKYRDNALHGLARFMSLAIDANPSMVLSGDLREYTSPEDAIAGLYERWKVAREPLVLLAYSHPSDEVRRLAFDVQAGLELVLRRTDDLIKSNPDAEMRLGGPQTEYERFGDKARMLGALLKA
ncbi:MAG: hypothetical protein JO082_15240 [Mycobacterium sp.]|nr:hypothetical protein [Mycobacterium sp.]MBV9723255.1 hypothetical protein [Mycobacterium sp.]